MRRVWSMIAIAVATVVDQCLKILVEHNLDRMDGRLALDPIIALRYVRNTGAAFSILNQHTNLLSIGTGLLLVAGVAVLLSGKIRSNLLYTAVTMIVAGGLGNLIDRVRLGYVVDFLEFRFMEFPVFNFADCLITVGAGLMIVWIILDTIRERKEKV